MALGTPTVPVEHLTGQIEAAIMATKTLVL